MNQANTPPKPTRQTEEQYDMGFPSFGTSHDRPDKEEDCHTAKGDDRQLEFDYPDDNDSSK